MLVLSRRRKEKILFPTINATIQVVSIKSGTVRLGIEAPSHVPVFREEARDRFEASMRAAAELASRATHATTRDMRHKIRNWLNTANLALALLRRQLQNGSVDGTVMITLDTIDLAFQDLLRDVDGLTESAPPPPPATRQRKALLVEDDRNECELLAGLLRMSGYAVDTTNDGVSALDYLSAHAEKDRPDVMLLDMAMPNCDGAAVVRAVRGEPAFSGFKIFAVSGHRPEEFDLDTGPARVDCWFQKPIHPEELLRELNHELSV